MKIVDQPPIVEITAAAANSVLGLFAQKCLAFGQSLSEHGSSIVERPDKPDFPIQDTAKLAADTADGATLYFRGDWQSSSRLFAYILDGFPVGVMVCVGTDMDGYERLESLSCNSGLSGCGAALIEVAVDLSEGNGSGGKVALMPLNDAVKPVYESYGFASAPSKEGLLLLDPAASPKWNLVPTPTGLRYRLNPKLSYIGD